jgi:hypothetical protein
MKLRFISPTSHGIIDYAAAIALVTAPFLLGLGSSNPAALWISVMTGIVVVLVSVSTNYRYGVLKMIPFGGHLALDLLVATGFMLLPYILKMEGLDAAYYYANAAVVYLVVALTASGQLSSI